MLTLAKKNDFLSSFTDEFFKPWNYWFDNRLSKKISVPAVNIAESDAGFSIDVAAPGLKKTDFSIDLDGDVLTISAKSEKTKEEKNEDNYTWQEYNYSSFSRSLTLPENADQDKITATYDGGVLKLSVPKKAGAETAAAKKITIG